MDGKVFVLKTGGSRTCEELVMAGHYDYANPSIASQNFPVRPSPEGTATVELLEFDRVVTSEEVLAEAKRRGFARPSPEHAPLFGEQHPEEQRERPILFLHEPWLGPGGSRNVLSLWSSAGSRGLSLVWFGSRWNPRYRFAFLRPSTRAPH